MIFFAFECAESVLRCGAHACQCSPVDIRNVRLDVRQRVSFGRTALNIVCGLLARTRHRALRVLTFFCSSVLGEALSGGCKVAVCALCGRRSLLRVCMQSSQIGPALAVRALIVGPSGTETAAILNLCNAKLCSDNFVQC